MIQPFVPARWRHDASPTAAHRSAPPRWLSAVALALLLVLAPTVVATPARADAAAPADAPPSLIPRPSNVDWHSGDDFTLDHNTRIVAPEGSIAAERLAERLRAATGFAIPIQHGRAKAAGTIRLVLVGNADLSGEAYRLQSSRRDVVIEAATDAGLFRGVQTLRQLLPASIEHAGASNPADTTNMGPWVVPGVEIADQPRFGHRAIQLDVARSFLTVDEVKKQIDSFALFKLNVLHLHLSDDQAWRIEITNEGRAPGDDIDYTLLTEISGATAKYTKKHGDGMTGFYTQEEYTEIVRYAAGRHMLVVPEIDMPGHSRGALHAIPQLNTPGTVHSDPHPPPGETVPQNGWTASLDPHSEVTYQFASHVFKQLAELTPGPYIHVGADESRLTTAEYDLFLDRLLPMVRGLGKTLIGWDEYSGSAESGDVIQHWHNDVTSATNRAVAGGAKVIASPSLHTYLNRAYNATTWPGTTPYKEVVDFYDWDPVTDLAPIPEQAFLGVEAPLWSETVRGNDSAQYLVLPRAAATAEVGWTPPSLRETADFVDRLADFGGRLTLAGHNFFDTPTVPWTHGVWPLRSTGVVSCEPLDLALVTAPGTTQEQVSAVITWSDGVTSEATMSLARAPDRLHATGLYTVSTSRPAPRKPGAAHRTLTAVVTVSTPSGTRSATAEVAFEQGGPPGPRCDV